MKTRERAGGSPRRAARQHARELQRQRVVRQKRLRLAIWAGIALIAIAGVAFFIVRSNTGQPGRFVQIMGAQHIEKGATHAPYNSKPATSGPHWNLAGEAPVPPGIYKEPVPEEGFIHNMEHGYVVITYSCRDCPELVGQIEDFYNGWVNSNRSFWFPTSTKVVVTPYYDMPNKIALASWGRLDTFDTWDEQRAIKFIEAFRDKGPESMP